MDIPLDSADGIKYPRHTPLFVPLMKLSAGKANPKLVDEILRKLLESGTTSI